MPFNTEVLIFDTSEAFRENQTIITNALKPTLQAKGANSPGYYGIQVENPNTGYIMIHWDNYEIHKEFATHPSFPAINKEFRPSLGGGLVVYDVDFLSPTIALEKPVTEVFVFSLKASEHREAVLNILTMFSEANNRMLVFGQTRQDENKYVVLCGWQTVEEHSETSAKPQFAGALAKLLTLVNKEHFSHARLTKYWP